MAEPHWNGSRQLCVLVLVFTVLGAGSAESDVLVYRSPEGSRTVEGQLSARTSEELLFLGRDGQMHLVEAADLIEWRPSADPPEPITRDQMTELVRSEFGREFSVRKTAHYLIFYNTNPKFARDCGRLFERLHRSFTTYFTRQGFQMQPSRFPLVAVVFSHEQEFRAYAQHELGEQKAHHVIGYYSFLTNRMALYDLKPKRPVGLGNVATKQRTGWPRRIGSYSELNVATIIHEATHQLAYNSGFHQRFSDNPLWLAEGMAMFFETGDANGIGTVNRPRMQLIRKEYLWRARPLDIASLICTDDRLLDSQTATLAYAQSWALTYHLMKSRRKQFHEYLRILREKPPLAQDSPEQRLADFKAAFGQDIRKLERRFLLHMRDLR